MIEVSTYPAEMRVRTPSSTAMSSAHDMIIRLFRSVGMLRLKRGRLNIQASQRSPKQKPIPLPDASTNICWEVEKSGRGNGDDGRRIEGEGEHEDGRERDDDEEGDGSMVVDVCLSPAG